MNDNDSDHPIYKKIEEGIVTKSDFEDLLNEAMPESVRDRVRRRTTKNVSKSHIDNDGHQSLELPTLAARVEPKRKSSGKSQMTARGKAAHRKSVRTQKRKREAENGS